MNQKGNPGLELTHQTIGGLLNALDKLMGVVTPTKGTWSKFTACKGSFETNSMNIKTVVAETRRAGRWIMRPSQLPIHGLRGVPQIGILHRYLICLQERPQ
jgi:hypothetical protein